MPRLTRPANGGRIQRRPGGTLIRSVTTHPTGGSGSGPPCCCKTCGKCQVGTVPYNLTLTSSGITQSTCSGCYSTGHAPDSFNINTQPTGTWIVTQDLQPTGTIINQRSDPQCNWVGPTFNSITFTEYTDACSTVYTDCFGTPQIFPVTATFQWSLFKSTANWILWCIAEGGPGHGCGMPAIAAFLGIIATADIIDCSQVLTFSNTLSACAITSITTDPLVSGDFFGICTGGMAILTPHL